MSNAAIAAHAPAQHNVVTYRGCRQVNCCGYKANRGPSPRRTSSERVTTAGANCPSVATRNKAAARGDDVRKCPTVDADLHYAAVKATLQVVVLAESQLRRGEDDGDDWRIEPLVIDGSGIIYPRGVRQRIGDWRRHSGI